MYSDGFPSSTNPLFPVIPVICNFVFHFFRSTAASARNSFGAENLPDSQPTDYEETQAPTYDSFRPQQGYQSTQYEEANSDSDE